MILVTVGTEQYPFDRLMTWITALINDGFIQEEVIVQYGTCTMLPPGSKVFKYLKSDSFLDLVHQARIIISHCGEGSLLLLEEVGTPYLLVPRSAQLKEHVDDHQVELAIALSEMGAPIAWSPGDIARFLNDPQRVVLSSVSTSSTSSLCKKLHDRVRAVAYRPQRSF